MSKTFNVGTIIFLVVVYNVLFDDDEDEIEIVDKAKNVVVKIKEIVIKTKDSEGVQEIINKAKEKLKLNKGTDEEEKEVAEIEEEEKLAEIEKEKIVEEKPEARSPPHLLVPVKDEPKTEEFEKL